MPYSVLIVDDEMLIREGLRRHLDWATLDMEVIGVADGAESALEIARRRAPDILITDICMRSKTGFDLIEDLLELGLSPQVILISSYNDFSYAQRAVRLNVVREYILKPVDTDALTALLHKLRGELNLRPAPRRAEEDGGADIPVHTYRSFLQDLRSGGYDRHRFVHCVKHGETQEALAQWACVEQVVRAEPHHLASAQRFCTNLLMLLISEGILSSEGEDPVHALRRCADTEAMCACMRDTVAAECAHKCAQAPLAQSKLIAASLDLIEKHYRDPRFNLTALAAELCVTPNYLSIRFKEEMGVGFMKYLLDRQIETAKRLLADPQYKVYQVSEMVGFQDEKYFSRQFKKLVGVTPKEYRNEHTSPL